jgi:hypothetical protein
MRFLHRYRPTDRSPIRRLTPCPLKIPTFLLRPGYWRIGCGQRDRPGRKRNVGIFKGHGVSRRIGLRFYFDPRFPLKPIRVPTPYIPFFHAILAHAQSRKPCRKFTREVQQNRISRIKIERYLEEWSYFGSVLALFRFSLKPIRVPTPYIPFFHAILAHAQSRKPCRDNGGGQRDRPGRKRNVGIFKGHGASRRIGLRSVGR